MQSAPHNPAQVALTPDTGLLAQARRFTRLVQPSEARMQEAANARERHQLLSPLPCPVGDFQGASAPAQDLAEWNRTQAEWRAAHPDGPNYAPPEYIAWANTRLAPASATPYRFEVQYVYDPASGALAAVENAGTGFIYWEAAEGAGVVDGFGHLLDWTDGNNVSTTLTDDAATGAPLTIRSGVNGTSAVQNLNYTWDGYGNLAERADANRSLSETFEYDDLNRLTQSSVTNPANTGALTQFGYDLAGNIKTKAIGGTVESYSYDPNHPYAVDSVSNGTSTLYSASYDDDGDMVTRNGEPLTWTVNNLPQTIAASTGSSTFSYGPEDQRYYQSATFNGVTTHTTYIGSLFEIVSSTSGTEYRHNILADGQVMAVHTIDENGTASTSYLHYDHLGSVNALTGDSGTVIQSMSFGAFGQRRDASNWDDDLSEGTIETLKSYTDRGYIDEEELDNVSLVDLNGRVYDPTTGRFISADPTVPGPLFSQAFNRYSYTYNDPLRYVDPSGFSTGSVCKQSNAIMISNAEGGGGMVTYAGGTKCSGSGNSGSSGGSGESGSGGTGGSSSGSTAGGSNGRITTPLGPVSVTAPKSSSTGSQFAGPLITSGSQTSNADDVGDRINLGRIFVHGDVIPYTPTKLGFLLLNETSLLVGGSELQAARRAIVDTKLNAFRIWGLALNLYAQTQPLSAMGSFSFSNQFDVNELNQLSQLAGQTLYEYDAFGVDYANGATNYTLGSAFSWAAPSYLGQGPNAFVLEAAYGPFPVANNVEAPQYIYIWYNPVGWSDSTFHWPRP